MTMVRGNFAQLMAPGLHGTFVHWLKLKQRDEEYSHVFNIETSDKAFEDIAEFTGLGPMPTKPEGEAITYQDAAQGGSKRYINTSYGLGVRMSWELHDDDQYGIINQIPKCLARSAHFTKEQQAWNVFNLGFTTMTTSDGVSLFNNQHPLSGGSSATNIGPGVANIISAAGTYPNRPAVDLDISFTAVQFAINQFERMIDGQGLPIQFKPRLAVIPPELKWIAREIFGSPHKPYVADNEINSLLKEDLSYFVCHYLTGASPWFLVTDKESHSLTFMLRKDLDQDFADDFDTRSLKEVATMRFTTGATTWWGTWGSNGP